MYNLISFLRLNLPYDNQKGDSMSSFEFWWQKFIVYPYIIQKNKSAPNITSQQGYGLSCCIPYNINWRGILTAFVSLALVGFWH